MIRKRMLTIVMVMATLGFAVFVGLALLKPYRVPSGTMEPTVSVGSRVLVDRFGIGGFSVGDVVVFHPPLGAETAQCGNSGQGPFYPGGPESHFPCDTPTPQESGQTFIKRVVAGPGDTVSIQGGYAIVNSKLQEANYVKACGGGPSCDLGPIKIPDGHWFMMGDNRGDSLDSRFWGPVPTDSVIGRVIAQAWPFSRFQLL